MKLLMNFSLMVSTLFFFYCTYLCFFLMYNNMVNLNSQTNHDASSSTV